MEETELAGMFRFILLLFCASAAAAQPKPKVVLVIADGIPADVIERLQPPALMTIAQEGAYKRAFVGGIRGTYAQTPTISAPGYTDMLTGTWAYKHNVWDNENQHPNYHYPTIFRLLRSLRPASRLAIFSTWTDNRTVLLGEDLAATDHLRLDDRFDGYEKDTARFRHDRSARYLHAIDDQVVHEADSVIRAGAPDLSWIYLEYTDDVGHAKGTGAAFDSAVGFLDRQMSLIREAIRFREATQNEKWLLIITTDHGRDSVSGRGHGGQSARERTTWMIQSRKGQNEYFRTHEPAIVDIYPTVCDFLGLSVPEALRAELDGVPMLGPVSLSGPSMILRGDTLDLRWTGYDDAPVRIGIAYTDAYKTGGEDHFAPLGETTAARGRFSVVVPGLSARPFYKIVLRGGSNTANLRNR